MRVLLAALVVLQSSTGSYPGVVQALEFAPASEAYAIRVGEQLQLVYEVRLTSFANVPVRLERLETTDEAGVKLTTLTGPDLESALGRTGPVAETDRLHIAPAAHATLFLNVPAAQRAPREVHHRLFMTVETDGAARSVTIAQTIRVDVQQLPALAPPLRGGIWAALYDPNMERGHRRVLYAVDGSVHLPGRFAIDFFGLERAEAAIPPQAGRPEHYPGYGAEVLAVASGKVVALRDDVPDPSTIGPRRVALSEAAGNYVVLDIGGGRYAHYEHLRRGVAVRLNQRVQRGQALGRLGMTGQASAPHLHFHVASSPASLAAEGLPYAFERYREFGNFMAIRDYGVRPWTRKSPDELRSGSLPVKNSVITFE